ncbi:MAG: tRNA uridine(34) 5-carboxymethylaminomethyl modification radical SAM/GNAT enzyme Elp3 [Eggerthellaceae bacterium]|nr:tRNA uridine(34) 5-carboxymethylaminomethyl modification radical SAM/GNAT enzyme Elp3 [Eggerthellaceae bacterium]
MEEALKEIAALIKQGASPTHKDVERILRERSRAQVDPSRRLSKRSAMALYVKERDLQGELWREMALDDAEDSQMVRLLRAKPRRTASGVATVSVLTKPWPCAHDCIYCPNDVRMPKSYISDEPACQRALRCHFDPYLQMASRLRTLASMGHVTDKAEVIVLGGTWADYPKGYRMWFTCQLFRAMNEFGTERQEAEVERRVALYASACESSQHAYQAALDAHQEKIDAGEESYAEAFSKLAPIREEMEPELDDASGDEELICLQAANETAPVRCVGLVFETRPDTVDAALLTELRTFGATKIQLGIQSLDDDVLAKNCRGGTVEEAASAVQLAREFGFKTHVHLMANLMGATPDTDLAQYERLMEDARFMPDEVKLYPCALVESARLTSAFESGEWQPYSEDELTDLLIKCVLATPSHTRISRMIRDIPSTDIIAGSKRTNLRQMVEERAQGTGIPIKEMRMREVATSQVLTDQLTFREHAYDTSSTQERFLEWVTDDDRLAGFLRLSLPEGGSRDAAMIREVHIYGSTSRIHESEEGVQHLGLGTQLIERACQMAKGAGFSAVDVISAVGTRGYYRSLGFEDAGLYQRRKL